MKTEAFYKLTNRRNDIESAIEEYNMVMSELKYSAKKLKKGSPERQDLYKRVNDLKNDEVYKTLQTELKIMNFCINTVFYS